MLYDFSWLDLNESFPPLPERARIERYAQNSRIFDGDHFADPKFRTHSDICNSNLPMVPAVNLYLESAKRIERVIGNFSDVISFPVLLNYQRLMSLKMSDLVCGEYPNISGSTEEENEALKDVRDNTDFDAKIYSAVIDISRFGDAILRIYKDYNDKYNFSCWTPEQWFPVVAQDGTNTVIAHCLCWIENKNTKKVSLMVNPGTNIFVGGEYYLHVQIHYTGNGNDNPENHVGYYEDRIYRMDNSAQSIKELISSTNVETGLDCCAVIHLKPYALTNSVYGLDDYLNIDSILAEIMTRIGQISVILDKHADPNMSGPVSMLERDYETGEYHLKTGGKYFAVSEGESDPKYLVWEGQLQAAFNQLEFLINQLYILSEMGAALLGSDNGSSQAVSGTAMRFKMVNPLSKARRVANTLTRPIRLLLSALSATAEIDESSIPKDTAENTAPLELPIPYRKISVSWKDGLPDDPRENIENCKLATGALQIMPLTTGIMTYFDKSNEEALAWEAEIEAKEQQKQEQQLKMEQEYAVNTPGPQNGTGVNPQKKGSETGMNNFHSSSNGSVK